MKWLQWTPDRNGFVGAVFTFIIIVGSHLQPLRRDDERRWRGKVQAAILRDAAKWLLIRMTAVFRN
jgi:hypothetical protein